MKYMLILIVIICCFSSLSSNTFLQNFIKTTTGVFNNEQKPASDFTKQVNNEVLKSLPFENNEDFDDAEKGFIAKAPIVKSESGREIWNISKFDFITGEAPETVNPSLWRQAKLNNYSGLFKVSEGVYQVRGMDISNMSIIEGIDGIIVIDPLVSSETAKAALELYFQNRPKKPITAVIYTHSHIDHFGGVEGIVSQADVDSGKVQIIAPSGFLNEAVSENVYAGNAMKRRATYMYGAFLPVNEKGLVDNGIGKTNSLGSRSLILPTKIISETGTKLNISGIEMLFHFVPDTEAPSEMNIYFPELKVLDIAEDATKTQHNIYTLRGAQIRNALAWQKSIDQAIDLFGSSVEVLFTQHTWPTWGNQKIINQLKHQRDLYKFIHDQTLYLANNGYTSNEIAEMVNLPDSLSKEWYNRGYYGTLRANVKSVFQKYLGWYNGNPVYLNPLPPQTMSKKYIDYMGGDFDPIISKANEDYEKGDYRWVAQIMNDILQVDPNNEKARMLEADALEQLGYQSESGPWRNEYLMGAFELRNGVPDFGGLSQSEGIVNAMSMPQIYDTLSLHLNSQRADNKNIKIKWVFTDIKQIYTTELENSVLLYKQQTDKKTKKTGDTDASITMEKSILNKILADFSKETIAKYLKYIKIEGNKLKVLEFFGLFDPFNDKFNIITPNSPN